jgi:HTH-type transcriptional regulator/antitoxin MqsA
MNTRACVCCGSPERLSRFEDRTFNVTYQLLSRDIPGISGWECRTCADVEFDADSAIRYARAGDQLIEQANRAVVKESFQLVS